MPRVVDHEQRRRQIAEAVWRVIAARGLDAVSVRDVAREAGVSTGMVQHYFATKDAMLVFACERMVELAREGLEGLLESAPESAAPRTVLRSVAVQSLPADELQRAGASVWHAFVGRAIVHPQLATFIGTVWSGTRELLTQEIRAAQGRGEVGPAVDADAAAFEFQVLIDGLVSHLLVEHCTAPEALVLIDHHLERLFAGSRRGG